MTSEEQSKLNDFYRKSFLEHKGAPEAVHSSASGQLMRFDKLMEIGELSGMRILDLGCGQGDLYSHLLGCFHDFHYVGMDVVPEMIEFASARFPEGQFVCRDILSEPLQEKFDYVLLCGLFNIHIPNCAEFMRKMLQAAFACCEKGIGFNFISSHVNYTTEGTTYHNPAEVLEFCIRNLGTKVSLHHHYGRADVAVFVYR